MKKYTRLTAALLAAALLLTSCGGGASAATMHLRKTEGTVGVSDNEGKDIAPKDNLGLYSGYQVGTQAESYAWIDLDKVKLTKLDANSEIEIAKEGKKLEIDVKSGSLFFNVTEPLADDETMDIRTSSMMVGIRGTCGWVTEDTAALLEGTVSVTAGDQEVTVNAGEMAVLKDGTLEVRPLTASSVPAFVREEIAEDEDLAQAVLDATGLNIPAYSMASYEELLSTLENVVYSELIDFEGDGSPELLVITMDFYAYGGPSNNSDNIYGLDNILFYRNGPNGPYSLSSSWSNINEKGTFSLVESNGKLFVHRWVLEKEDGRIFEYYCGSVAQSNGVKDDWGVVDRLGIDGNDVWIYPHKENGLTMEGVPDSYDSTASETVRSKYTHVRDLITFDGTNVTVFEP